MYTYTAINLAKKQEFARLTVKPDTNFKGDILRVVKSQVAAKTFAKFQEIDKTSNGVIYIKCNSEKDSEDITVGNYSDSIPDNLDIIINSYSLNWVFACTYLGVTFDANITWNIHVENIVKKAKYLVYVFYRLKHILIKSQLLTIYYGLFHSIVAYIELLDGVVCTISHRTL